MEEWLTRFEKARDWSVLTIELQLHAMRSPSFAESYAAVWMEHEQRVALMLRRMFERLGQTPPADVTPIAAGLIALTNGLVVQQSAGRPTYISATIAMFLRAVLTLGAE
ncbi:TPA: TetR family transcriptional regulator C-terminal domain-containing protein [Klebsiella pneumoniae]|nr:TetR family transcriptional regulator C-terminal domain-containing protein [Klebsiella variicola]WMJ67524.1 TetR family transcriptional regulator C-terminal domain-containing protein [Klebsiella variicola]